jgi:hypothetical protein
LAFEVACFLCRRRKDRAVLYGEARFYRKMPAMPTRRNVHRAAPAIERRIDQRETLPGRVSISPYRGFGREGETK